MITVVPSHQFPVFKFFYEHNLHRGLLNNLILYIDKSDENEIKEFRSIIDSSKTAIFTQNDIKTYYGDLYIPGAKYNKKMYFLNMLAEMGLLNDDLYMTDDDILVYDNSFYDIFKEDKIIHDHDTWPKIEKYKNSWPNVYKWYNDNISRERINIMATNFYIPKGLINEFTNAFISKFYTFIRLLKEEEDYINKSNEKTTSMRGCSFLIFYLEVPFFDNVFSEINKEHFRKIPITCVAPSELKRISEKYNTKDTNFIMKKFVKKPLFPQKQPLLHYNHANKIPFMHETFNYLNNKKINWSNIDDLLTQYPKIIKK